VTHLKSIITAFAGSIVEQDSWLLACLSQVIVLELLKPSRLGKSATKTIGFWFRFLASDVTRVRFSSFDSWAETTRSGVGNLWLASQMWLFLMTASGSLDIFLTL